MQDLGTLGGTGSNGLDINDSGRIVGASITATGDERAFLYKNGQMQDLGTLEGNYSGAQAINANDHIVGGSQTANGEFHAFLYSDVQMHDLDPFGSTYSTAYDINDSGQVIGNYFLNIEGLAGNRSFLYSDGQIFAIGSLLAVNSDWHISSADAINNKGQILTRGCYQDGLCSSLLLTPHGRASAGSALVIWLSSRRLGNDRQT